MSIFEEEQDRLDITISGMSKEIKAMYAKLDELRKVGLSLSFEDKKRGEHLKINDYFDQVVENIGVYERSINNPYFGRIDFNENSTIGGKQIYIGKSGINVDGVTLVTDWRAPICSLYYDSEIGKVSYDSPSGKQYGYLNLKRQINIKDKKLISAVDTSLVTNDELLKPYLNNNADNKMKTIIGSIQKEQNSIIRRNILDNIIVQGVAGSGKTSVALHRIAYLIYNMGNNVSSSSFIVLGPNNYFLNYISSILPDLETFPVNQSTLLDFTNDYLGLKTKIKMKNEGDTNAKIDLDVYKKIQSFKSSLFYRSLISNFFSNYLKQIIVTEGFTIDDCEVFSKDRIEEVLFMDGNVPNFSRTTDFLVEYYKENCDNIYTDINEKYRKIYTSLPFNDPNRDEVIKKSNELSDTIRKDGVKLLKNYLKKLEKTPLELYSIFIESLGKIDIPEFTEKEKFILQSETLKDIKNKSFNFTDLSALLYVNYLYSNKKLDYKNVVIDEAQDYGLFHFAVLKDIAPKAVFSIYGDLAQSIYSYRSIKNWEEVNDKIFNLKANLLNLSKSYRTTIEITNNANKVLNKLQLSEAVPVIRHGAEISFRNSSKDINYKVELIKEWLLKQYKSIAVICKDETEAKKINKLLNENGIISNYLSISDQKYDGGVQVLTSASSKGLEFDAVIVNDASEEKYSSNSDVDMHLLYVASTRALHEEVILYDKEINKAYQDCVNDNKDIKTKIKSKTKC